MKRAETIRTRAEFSRRNYSATAAAAVTTILINGCGLADMIIKKQPCALPKSTSVMLQASDRVNVDDSGRSLPTVVNLLQVPSLDKIEGSSFDDLWLHPEETFQDQLLGNMTHTIYPGQSLEKPLSIELAPKARFLVAMAIFRQPSGTTWRATYELPSTEEEICEAENKGIYLRFMLQDSQIEGGEETPPKNEAQDDT